VAYGVKVISIGMFIEPTEPGGRASSVAVAWRGPMLHRTLNQFLTDVYFGDLDVLLVDLPPGTGDVAISLGQLLPNAEVVVVTTPQPAAADVAERSGVVARQTGQHIVGVIENMAGFAEPGGGIVELFGAGGGAEVAKRLSAGQEEPVPLLASVPLSIALRRGGDAGAPVVASEPDDPAARAIEGVANVLAARPRSLQGRRLDVSVR
jgi:ATP-binding protein involved in chromosome partitioning